jgi:hypothetical protein
VTIVEIYRQSKKKKDNFWTEWISRPPAAVLVWLLRGTPITPNQVSFLAIFIAAAGAALLIAWPTWLGLIVAGLTLQLAYIIDCVDGQLARLKQLTSPVGALLDFMLDEVKAFMVLGAAAVRLWRTTPGPAGLGSEVWLLIGIAGLAAAATGITLTSFVRRPEYLEYTGAPPILPSTERSNFFQSLSPKALLEAAGRYTLHYPSWFLFVCAFNRLDIFLYAYVGAHFLYLGRTALIVVLKLSRPPKKRAETAKETA